MKVRNYLQRLEDACACGVGGAGVVGVLTVTDPARWEEDWPVVGGVLLGTDPALPPAAACEPLAPEGCDPLAAPRWPTVGTDTRGPPVCRPTPGLEPLGSPPPALRAGVP